MPLHDELSIKGIKPSPDNLSALPLIPLLVDGENGKFS